MAITEARVTLTGLSEFAARRLVLKGCGTLAKHNLTDSPSRHPHIARHWCPTEKSITS